MSCENCENCEESAYVIDKLAKLLAEIAIIVNGTEPHDTLWSYHDLPEKVRALRAQQPATAVPDVLPVLLSALQAAEAVFREHGFTLQARGEYKQICAVLAKAAWPLAEQAKQPAAAVPEGYALVPVEPTTAMKCRAVEAWEGQDAYTTLRGRPLAELEIKAAECWAAMLAAERKGGES